MKSRDRATNAQNTPTDIRSHVPEGAGENSPSLAEIRQPAFEIHIERGGIHGCIWPTGRRRNASSARGTRALQTPTNRYEVNSLKPTKPGTDIARHIPQHHLCNAFGF